MNQRPTIVAVTVATVIAVAAFLMEGLRAAPVLAPELKYCHVPLSLPDEEQPFSCCAPDLGQVPKEFDLEANAAAVAGKLRVRRAAHAMSDADVARLSRAYALMRNLSQGDPRNYDQQANIHCAYCSACYQMGNSSTPLQVHGSWLFFAFHRFYIYFHERILAKLVGDDEFYLPFWNYDHPDGMYVPDAYVADSELRDEEREPACLPPSTVFTDFYYYNASIRTHEEQVAANLATVYRQIVAAPSTPYRFYGQPYRSGDGPQPGYGTVETQPHNSLHGWTGNQKNILGKDMGALYAAARDPVFYIHHVNLDRLWDVWMSFGRDDIDDPDYLDSEFIFYDENAELVKVKVRDAYNTTKLGYIYEFVENPWLNLSLSSLSNGTANETDIQTVCSLNTPIMGDCSIMVNRNLSSENSLDGEETLVLEGITGDVSSPALFDVFVNLPQATVHTLPNCTEYVGRFSTMAQPLQAQATNTDVLRTSARFGIGANIRDLGLHSEPGVVVTIVSSSYGPLQPVSISNIWIEYELTPSAARARLASSASASTSTSTA